MMTKEQLIEKLVRLAELDGIYSKNGLLQWVEWLKGGKGWEGEKVWWDKHRLDKENFKETFSSEEQFISAAAEMVDYVMDRFIAEWDKKMARAEKGDAFAIMMNDGETLAKFSPELLSVEEKSWLSKKCGEFGNSYLYVEGGVFRWASLDWPTTMEEVLSAPNLHGRYVGEPPVGLFAKKK